MNTTTSEYMLLFRGKDWDEGLSPEELDQIMGRVMAWFEGLKQQDKVKAAQPLGRTGRRISGQKGRAVVDGPFVESKEAVGGYLVLKAKSLDEAIAIAKTCPTLEYGITIEVRPVLDECPTFARARQRLSFATA